ncbi:3-hydroxyisobutyrate dehydrogenase, partial [Pseudomonas aeruginosa]
VPMVCNNQHVGVLMSGPAEPRARGGANALDAKVLAEIMRRSSGGNWALEDYNPWPGVMENAPASRDYRGGNMAQLMAKD